MHCHTRTARTAALSPAIALLGNLTVLDLQGNQLTSLPSEIIALASLRDLVLSFNRFRTLPACVYDLLSLENLIVNDNALDTLDPEGLEKLPVLSCLDVSNNNIGRSVSWWLWSLNQRPSLFPAQPPLPCVLMRLCVDVLRVPPELGRLKLSTLKLEGNVFKIPRPNILARGTPAVLAYLKDRIPT